MDVPKVTAALAVVAALSIPSTASAAGSSPRCVEDDACWTWSTMGNRSRGVVLTDGRRVVVRPCRFARLDARGRIDWQRSPRLKGDATARTRCGR
jgi:hypothetical protein